MVVVDPSPSYDLCDLDFLELAPCVLKGGGLLRVEFSRMRLDGVGWGVIEVES